MRRVAMAGLLVGAVVLCQATRAWASAQSEIDGARGEGKAVFLVVTEPGTPGTEEARAIAARAHALAPATQVVVLDRKAAENQDLVRSLRVLAAPVPLLLVLASNGVVAGGTPLQGATAEGLVRSIPTPRKAEMLLHVSRKTPVFVVVSSKAMVAARSEIFIACTEALRRMDGKAATVIVDTEDEAEKAWIEELNVRPGETAPVTTVFNASGQKAQVFRGQVTASQLVEAATRKASCCPGGDC